MNIKDRKSILLAAGLICIEVYFVLFIALTLLLFYDLSLLLFLVTIVTIIALAIGALFYWKKKKDLINFNILVSITLLLIWLLPQIFVLTYIEIEYVGVKKHYLQEYNGIIGNQGKDELNASWDIAYQYKMDFKGSYGKAELSPPNRILHQYRTIYSFFVPISWLYISTLDGFNKLLVVQSRGGCGEFAWTAAFFLNDVTGLNTRVVSFEGVDHAFPEVEVNNVWWVFDLVYTTQYYPIKAHNFASHLKMQNFDLYNHVANLKKRDTGETLLAEHGFFPSNLTITTIRDITNNPSDDEPATNAEVEIFAFQNQYDPLVAKGGTDNFGNYTVTLNSGKEYLILVKEGEPIPIVGLDRINLSSPNESIVVYLHKYQ